MQPATNGTDERLDELIELTNRLIEQHDELIDIGRKAIDAINALLPGELLPGLASSPEIASGDRQVQRPEACDVKEPARRRKKP
jgi:hypothetical protein